jgi:hypothetical protein
VFSPYPNRAMFTINPHNTYKRFRNYLAPFTRNEHHFNEENKNNHVRN